MTSRLNQQLQFILEIDRLKQIRRQTRLADGSRRENSAEHSWHLALMAWVLAEYAPVGAEPAQAIAMLLIHDLVEIDAGDTFCYDTAGYQDKAAREAAAAERLFGLLPTEQGEALQALWHEFEGGTTATARFANALDRLQPFWLNQQNQGGTWREHNIVAAQVWERMAPVEAGAPALWPAVEQVIAACLAAGYLRCDPRAAASP